MSKLVVLLIGFSAGVVIGYTIAKILDYFMYEDIDEDPLDFIDKCDMTDEELHQFLISGGKNK